MWRGNDWPYYVMDRLKKDPHPLDIVELDNAGTTVPMNKPSDCISLFVVKHRPRRFPQFEEGPTATHTTIRSIDV
jgi:hypothetical protein